MFQNMLKYIENTFYNVLRQALKKLKKSWKKVERKLKKVEKKLKKS